MNLISVGFAATVIPAYFIYNRVKRNRRRKEFIDSPLPAEWNKIIEENVALYHHIPDSLKKELHGHIQILIAEKNFEGCGGIEMNDEIKIIVAAQAAILLLNRRATYFPVVDSILVYPGAYVAEKTTPLGNHYMKETTVRAGESSTRGAVVLAWDHVILESRNLSYGRNVVLHEFAHQLDQEDRHSNGVPILNDKHQYEEWSRIFSKEFFELQSKVGHNRRDVIDAYGATNPAEFFAVATETFFVRGKDLKHKHPALYKELKDYYRLDPADWH